MNISHNVNAADQARGASPEANSPRGTRRGLLEEATGSLWFFPLVIALLGTLAVLIAIDPVGDFPRGFSGPGLTLDEPFNVQQGVLLVDRLLGGDLAGARQVGEELPDHPPLGRLWLGVWHEIAFLLTAPVNRGFSIACARIGSAVAFGGLLFLVGWFASRWYGRTSGCAAAVALCLMPRVFGHAHLASLETCMSFTYALAVLYVADRWGGETAPTWRTGAKAGVLLGLALLTKIQAIFLPIPMALWALVVWKQRAILPLIVLGSAAFLTFVAGWPWLWQDTGAHLLDYLGRTTARASIQAWYFGQAFSDQDVPWHYPWVMFLVTVPVGLQFCGIVRLCSRAQPVWRSRRETLLLGCILLPLVVFTIPKIAVYDGTRLFLIVFSLWAIVIGRGSEMVLAWLRSRLGPMRGAIVWTLLFAAQGWGLYEMAPCWLSYYNLSVGGLRGAERLGFQTTYWGDSITRDLLDQVAAHVPEGAHVQVLPVMHTFQLREMQSQSPSLRQRKVVLEPFDPSRNPKYLVMFLRTDYVEPPYRQSPPGARLIASVQREGVLLAAFYEMR